ncbi:aldo/keto reductase [Erythrobacter sp. NE805]|uniref:aldo/keto reductase n=1 Tax=Erythrobacter sp. NE805 TaxID=3389875 RepID=UPI00396AF018
MMNKVQLPGTPITCGVLGMGCASLGSRVSRAQGLRALAAAHEQGVDWLDVAPVYGAGQAEEIIGSFVKGRRDRVHICSKVGLSVARSGAALRLAYALGRPLIGAAKGLRSRFKKVTAAQNVSVPLTPELIATSLESSLRRLGTDYLDMLALHRVEVADLARDEIRRALEDAVAAGKVRHVGVAGSVESAEAALAWPETFTILQLADAPHEAPLPRLRAAASRPPAFITHSVFGVGGAMAAAETALAANPALRTRLAEAGYAGGDRQVIADLLLDRALASNCEGVVLVSMYDPAHLAANVARARGPAREEAIALVAALQGAAAGSGAAAPAP